MNWKTEAARIQIKVILKLKKLIEWRKIIQFLPSQISSKMVKQLNPIILKNRKISHKTGQMLKGILVLDQVIVFYYKDNLS